MAKKDVLQQELKNLQVESDQIKKRRLQLAADLENVTTMAEALNAAVSAGLLDGRDVGNDRETLLKQRMEIDTLRDSIKLADGKIRLLDQEIKDKTGAIQMSDFFETVRKLEARAVAVMDRGREISAEMRSIIEGYSDLEKITPINMGGDAVQILNGIAKRLNQFYTVEGEHMLKAIETDHLYYIQAVRENRE
jgi:hypothetical protein